MLELADRLLPLAEAGARAALATSIDVVGGSPVPLGTSMVLTEEGLVLGSVSGGCVEQAALQACRHLLAGGPSAVHRFGFGADAGGGLACGGELDVLVHPFDAAASVDALRRAGVGRHAEIAFVTAGADLGRTVPAAGRLPAGSRRFVDVRAAAPRMVVIGATGLAEALVPAAAAAGYAVTVCDPRAAFASAARFPAARRVRVAPGHVVLAEAGLGARDAVCVLGHDEDLDPLALAVALEGGAGSVGALGSRATTARRRAQLRALGVAEPALARLRMPIGLDLGAVTAAETAVAILAEVLAARTGAGAGVLRDGTGPLHPRRTAQSASSAACGGSARYPAAIAGSPISAAAVLR